MNETPKKKVQYSYRLSKEKLREILGFSAEAKLEWLEEANKFVNEFVPSYWSQSVCNHRVQLMLFETTG
jgi:hypothetical protein